MDFEEHRDHLRAVAFRILGSRSDADDAVSEAWLRMNRSDLTEVRNPRGWLTTVVARVSLDMLRARNVGREEPWTTTAPSKRWGPVRRITLCSPTPSASR